MGRRIRLARLWGIPVSVDWGLAAITLVFVVGLAFQVLPQFGPTASLVPRLTVGVLTAGVFMLCVLAHEVGHALAARRAGIDVLAIILSVYGGSAVLDGHPSTPRSELGIAVAGPLANAVLSLLFGTSAWFYAQVDWDRPLLFGALVWLSGVNALLAVMNLIPVAPLDGGRVLTAGLWWRTGDAERARLISGRAGLAGGLVLLAAAAASLFWFPVEAVLGAAIAVFVIQGALQEISGAFVRGRLKATSMGQIANPEHTSLPDSTLALEMVEGSRLDFGGHVIPVHRWGTEPVGYLAVDTVQELSEAQRSWTPVGRLMVPAGDVDRVWGSESVDVALDRLAAGRPAMFVVHDPGTGAIVGTVGEAELRPLFDKPDWWGRQVRPDRGTFRPARRAREPVRSS